MTTRVLTCAPRLAVCLSVVVIAVGGCANVTSNGAGIGPGATTANSATQSLASKPPDPSEASTPDGQQATPRSSEKTTTMSTVDAATVSSLREVIQQPTGGGIPTSIIPPGTLWCAEYTLRDGDVVPKAVEEVGLICRHDREDPAMEVRKYRCQDGSVLYTAEVGAYWIEGEPAHVGNGVWSPDAQKACVEGPGLGHD